MSTQENPSEKTLMEAAPLSEELYQKFLNSPKPEKQLEIHYYKFKIFLILARYTKLSATTIGNLTRQDLYSLLKGNTVICTLPGNGHKRKYHVRLNSRGIREIQKFKEAIDFIFDLQENWAGTAHPTNWTRFLTSNFQRLAKQFNTSTPKPYQIKNFLRARDI